MIIVPQSIKIALCAVCILGGFIKLGIRIYTQVTGKLSRTLEVVNQVIEDVMSFITLAFGLNWLIGQFRATKENSEPVVTKDTVTL